MYSSRKLNFGPDGIGELEPPDDELNVSVLNKTTKVVKKIATNPNESKTKGTTPL